MPKSVASMNWELLASLAGSDIRIYTRGGLPFSGTVENIPFLNGTQLTGNDEFDGFLQEGSTPDASDPAAVTGRNRSLRYRSPAQHWGWRCLAAWRGSGADGGLAEPANAPHSPPRRPSCSPRISVFIAAHDAISYF